MSQLRDVIDSKIHKTMSQFEIDHDKVINFNGKDIPLSYYNLVVSIRDFKLHLSGLKPHRNWKVGTTAEYFGLKGYKAKEILPALELTLKQFKQALR